jgi:hypothetical protein
MRYANLSSRVFECLRAIQNALISMVVWKGRGVHYLLFACTEYEIRTKSFNCSSPLRQIYSQGESIDLPEESACCRLHFYRSCGSRPSLAYRMLVLGFMYIYFYIQYFNACDFCVGFIWFRYEDKNIVTCISDYRRSLDWMIGLLTPYTHHSELQAVTSNTALSLIYTLYSSPLRTHTSVLSLH